MVADSDLVKLLSADESLLPVHMHKHTHSLTVSFSSGYMLSCRHAAAATAEEWVW